MSYTYNDFSDVSMRTDARTVKTLYQYDALNRLVGVHYDLSQAAPGVAAMPDVCTSAIGQPANVCFSYGTSAASNNNGRLVGMTDPSGSESYTTYDVMGRVSAMSKSLGGVSYPLAYQYNFAGELTQVTYPSGRAVAQSYDAIGRLNQLQVNGANYLSGISYNAAYEPLNLTYGNGVAGTFTYNSRLQLSTLAYSSAGSPRLNLSYFYNQDATNCSAAPTGNNGQIQCIKDTTGTPEAGRSVTYTYDAWARLKTANTTGSTQYPAWGLSWSYDRYGNRKQQTVTAGSGVPSNSVTPSATTNRLTDPGYAYDLSGNMTNDGLNTTTYNGESRVASSAQAGTTTTYTHDGSGLRVKKQVGSATPTVYIFSGTKVIAEYASGAAPGSPSREYVYSGSQLLATIESGTTKYHISDHLSLRVTTDSSGTKVADSGHYPFGENWYETGGVNKLKFTSYERDAESGNDYAMMRTSINRLGRFSSPDPVEASGANPQLWNRYAYALNNPVGLVDPTGSSPCLAPLFGEGGNVVACFDSMIYSRGGGDPWAYTLAQAELRYDILVATGYDIEFGKYWDYEYALKQALRERMRHTDCAELLGGFDQAMRLIDSVSVSEAQAEIGLLGSYPLDITNPLPTPQQFQWLQTRIELGAVAEGIAASMVRSYGNPATGQWNGGPFLLIVGPVFANLSMGQQLTLAVHEMMHVAFRGPADRARIDDPGTTARIVTDCGTDAPPPATPMP